MNGIDFIADTNALIYFLDGNSCMLPYATKKLGFSIISEMELLSFSGITQEEEIGVKALLSDCSKFHLTEEIKHKRFDRLKELKKENIVVCLNEDARKGRLYKNTEKLKIIQNKYCVNIQRMV